MTRRPAGSPSALRIQSIAPPPPGQERTGLGTGACMCSPAWGQTDCHSPVLKFCPVFQRLSADRRSSVGPSEVLLQAGATITWHSDGDVFPGVPSGYIGWTICLIEVTTTSPVESTTVSPTATFAPTSAPTRVPSAMPTVDGSLTVTSGQEFCQKVTVDGNPNCVTDGEGDYVRHPLSQHLSLTAALLPPPALGTACGLRAHHHETSGLHLCAPVLRRLPLYLQIGSGALGTDIVGVPESNNPSPCRALASAVTSRRPTPDISAPSERLSLELVPISRSTVDGTPPV